MPKYYSDPGAKPRVKSDIPEETAGIYDRPKRKSPPIGLIVAIVIAAAILGWILLAGFAFAQEIFSSVDSYIPDRTRNFVSGEIGLFY